MSTPVNEGPTTIVACVNWVDLHPEVDPLSAAVHTDVRRGGFSDSDKAAVEVALNAAAASAAEVVVLSVAPAEAEAALLELAASGAARAVRVDGDSSLSAASVGRCLAETIVSLGRVSLVVCGDSGAEWGSGSVPGFIAHHLGVAQVLGVVEPPSFASVEPTGSGSRPGVFEAVRRLDGGRREVLEVSGPAVISVEGAVARLRRAPLGAVLSWQRRGVEVLGSAAARPAGFVTENTAPIRPRARSFAAPHGDRALDRIVELTGALVERTPPRTVDAEPAEAAAVIVEQLRAWGYLES
ncbi:MAG: putative mycofactocin-associated electron transfer flavoprotein [Actinobacteria bacterium]|nr:putative mycofactocin-associated electron transfer flavoprotein [Actinomycetota bacterium]